MLGSPESTIGGNYYAASLYNSNGGTLEIRKKVSGSSNIGFGTTHPIDTTAIYACTSYNNGRTSGSNFTFDIGTHVFINLLS